jgi:hypothetical protein
MKRVTSRIPQMKNTNHMIGRVLNSNCFPTFRGKLIYVRNEKCYFEILENPEFTKYNHCIGKIEYLPEYMVVCETFEDEDI